MKDLPMNGSRSILGLAFLLVSTLTFISSAQAFSVEAVKSADEILKETVARYNAGEVLAEDVALARYYLLDMKYHAGQTTRSAFCRSAKADLQTIADAFEEQDGQAGEKVKWQNAIAKITSTAAGCEGAITITEALLYGVRERPYTADDVRAAEDLAKAVKERAAMGQVTQRDVAQANYGLLEARYGAKLITRKAYCDAGVPSLQAISNAIFEESRVGQSSLQDVISTKRALYRLKAMCG
jgi:hypothetical protein